MGQEVVYCHLCGDRIVEKDLLAGRALTLLDKTFCHNCKEKAFAQMRSGEASPERAEAVTEPALQAPQVEPSVAAPRVALERERAPREPRTFPVRRRRNVLPLYIGGTVGFLALTALLILLIHHAQKKPVRPVDTGGGSSSSSGDGGRDPAASNAAADAAIKELEEYQKTASPDDVVRKCEQLADVLRGTRHEARWLEIKGRAEDNRTRTTAETELRKLIDRANAMIAEDKDYARYPEISRLIHDAREYARTKVPDMLPDVAELERKYTDPYEDAAKRWSDDRSDMLRALEQEKRFDQAIKVVDQFPAKYKHSKVWKQLERQRKDYEDKLRQVAAGGTAKGWKEYGRLADNDIANKNFKSARANYAKALELKPANWKEVCTQDEKKFILGMWYNLGCMDAVDAKKAQGGEKEKLTLSALAWLEKSFKEGLFTTACNCHGKWEMHLEKDEDIEKLREDERYKELLRKYLK